MLKRAVVGIAVVVLALGSQVQSASALPSWGQRRFACEGVTVQGARTSDSLAAIYITGFEDIHAKPTQAFWGAASYYSMGGHQFATSTVLVTHYSIADTVIIDEPVPVGQEAVTCVAVAGSPAGSVTADVVFLSPVPAAPPSVTYADGSSPSNVASPGVYEDQVVRSEPGDGCVAASPVADLSTVRRFCFGGSSEAPALFQVVDITVAPDLTSSLGVEVAPPRTPLAKADCKRGGWRDLVDDEGRPFRNQGRCIVFANHVRQ